MDDWRIPYELWLRIASLIPPPKKGHRFGGGAVLPRERIRQPGGDSGMDHRPPGDGGIAPGS